MVYILLIPFDVFATVRHLPDVFLFRFLFLCPFHCAGKEDLQTRASARPTPQQLVSLSFFLSFCYFPTFHTPNMCLLSTFFICIASGSVWLFLAFVRSQVLLPHHSYSFFLSVIFRIFIHHTSVYSPLSLHV